MNIKKVIKIYHFNDVFYCELRDVTSHNAVTSLLTESGFFFGVADLVTHLRGF